MDNPVRRLTARAARLRQRLRSDDGVTMAEMVAGMALMTVFLGMFTGAVTLLTQGSSRAENLTATSGQLNNVFIRLDKSIRYAAAISTPTPVANASNNYYVEFQTTNTGQAICTQLQLNTATSVLRKRTWVIPSSGPITDLTDFTAIGANLRAPAAPKVPFALTASGLLDFEQLTVTLNSGIGSSKTASDSSVTYTSVNSKDASSRADSDATRPDRVCQEAGRP